MFTRSPAQKSRCFFYVYAPPGTIGATVADPTRARSGLAQDALERIAAVPLVPARAGLVAERLRHES